LCELAADAVYFRKIVNAGSRNALQAAELAQQFAPFARPESRNRFEHGLRTRFGAPRAVSRNRESMRLVANALDQMQRRRIWRKGDRRVLAWAEQTFLTRPAIGALRDPRQGDAFDLQLLQDSDGLCQLPRAAID
jgi:hypothetical protein